MQEKEAFFAQSVNILDSFLLCNNDNNKQLKYLFVTKQTINEYKEYADKCEKEEVISSEEKASLLDLDTSFMCQQCTHKCFGPERKSKKTLMRRMCLEKFLSTDDNCIEFEYFKTIIVPDDIKYSELSNYLDQELEKENDNKIKKLVS